MEAPLSRFRQDLLSHPRSVTTEAHTFIFPSGLFVYYNISIMRLSLAVFSNVLFATTIFAAPSGSAEQVPQRQNRRFHAGSGRPISVPANSRANKRANPNHERQTNFQEV
jgi:hypothetical protein